MIKNIIIFFVIVGIILVSGCAQNSKENADAVAQGFAIDLQNSNYEALYELFTPELKKQRSKDNFVRYITRKGSPLENNYLIFDKVVMQGDNEAYAYYTLSGGILESKIPPIHLVFTSEGWRIDGFVSYFTEGCLSDSDCESNRQDIVTLPAGVVPGDLSDSEYESNRLRCNRNFECVECSSNSDCTNSEKSVCYNEHHCVECVNSRDCPSNKPACFINHCIECADNSHCPADKPVCHIYKCVECEENSDCPRDKPFCQTSQHSCNNTKKCTHEFDCKNVRSNRDHCLNGWCSYKECLEDDDCNRKQLCAKNRCINVECVKDEDCYTNEVCTDYNCNKVKCTKEGGCPLNLPICDTLTMYCVECESDVNCKDPEKPFCDNLFHRCIECKSDLDCELGHRCMGDSCYER